MFEIQPPKKLLWLPNIVHCYFFPESMDMRLGLLIVQQCQDCSQLACICSIILIYFPLTCGSEWSSFGINEFRVRRTTLGTVSDRFTILTCNVLGKKCSITFYFTPLTIWVGHAIFYWFYFSGIWKYDQSISMQSQS